MSSNLLVIGIDGGTWTVLQPAIDQGFMPFLKELVETGVQGVLRSTIPAITPVAWSAFQTGRGPGNLGICGWRIWNPETNESRFINSGALGPTLWTEVGDQGLRVATVNVPVTYPPRRINGCSVTGLLTPSVDTGFTYPSEFRDELLEAIPDYQILGLRGPPAVSDHGYRDFLKDMAKAAAMRLQVGQLLIEKEPWNLLMVHFQAHDVVEHRMWHHLDRSHPLHDEGTCRDLFENFYRPLDAAMRQLYGEFTDRSSNDSGVLVISDHGMQANNRVFNLREWLARHDLLSMNPKLARRHQWGLRLQALDFLNLRKFVSRKLRGAIGKTISPSFEDHTRAFDWQNTRAFAFPGSAEIGIHVVAKEGTCEYSEVVNMISTEFRELIDPQTGARVVERVRHKSEVWQGGKMHLMPDVIAELKEGYSYRFHLDLSSDSELFRDVTPGKDAHMGTHHRDGIIVAGGPGFKRVSDARCRLIDVAPTVLAYLGLDVPDTMDGQVVTELLENVQVKQRQGTTAEQREASTDNVFSASEEDIIEQRLRDLGYL